ncbi:hypothetical protein CKAH01_10156 [Colletotrichum kahawae]|uniref:Uncharacterized protein n=1 Tax=Colletotrichum kahawae TaxID=34407 RepID=A0AAD9XXX9_COLKA|nr:hypothetical protein CKAH01_10156 [Colletotrichum kahawae]
MSKYPSIIQIRPSADKPKKPDWKLVLPEDAGLIELSRVSTAGGFYDIKGGIILPEEILTFVLAVSDRNPSNTLLREDRHAGHRRQFVALWSAYPAHRVPVGGTRRILLQRIVIVPAMAAAIPAKKGAIMVLMAIIVILAAFKAVVVTRVQVAEAPKAAQIPTSLAAAESSHLDSS